jgi:hypothetical protein
MTTAAPAPTPLPSHPRVPEKDKLKDVKAVPPVQPTPWAFELARVTYNSWQGPRDQRDAVISDLATQLQALADSHASANADPPAEEPTNDTDARTSFKDKDKDDDDKEPAKPTQTPAHKK